MGRTSDELLRLFIRFFVFSSLLVAAGKFFRFSVVFCVQPVIRRPTLMPEKGFYFLLELFLLFGEGEGDWGGPHADQHRRCLLFRKKTSSALKGLVKQGNDAEENSFSIIQFL